MMLLRPANEEDAASLVEIYRPYVEVETASLEYDTPSIEEFSQRIRSISADFPYIVCEENGFPVGYAYAHRYKERFGYRFCAELTVYVKKGNSGRGIGSMLYSALTELLEMMGYLNLYAVVTDPNPGSTALHRSFGFTETGREHIAGVKFGKWYDVMLFEKLIGTHEDLTNERVCPYRITDIGEKYTAVLDKYSSVGSDLNGRK